MHLSVYGAAGDSDVGWKTVGKSGKWRVTTPEKALSKSQEGIATASTSTALDPEIFLGLDTQYEGPTIPQRKNLLNQAVQGNARAALALLINRPQWLREEADTALLMDQFPFQEHPESPYHAAAALLLSKLETPFIPAEGRYQSVLKRLMRKTGEDNPALRFILALNSLDLAKVLPKEKKDRKHALECMISSYQTLAALAEQGSVRGMYYLLYFASHPNYVGLFTGMSTRHGIMSLDDLISTYTPKLAEGRYPRSHILTLLRNRLTTSQIQVIQTHFPFPAIRKRSRALPQKF